MREYILLQCEPCGSRNYMKSKETKATAKLELKKYCKVCRVHTKHVERKRK
jgi:large subunit ribosomal protein L33